MLSKSGLILAKAAQGPLGTQALRALVAVASPALFRAAAAAQQQARAAQSLPLHSGDDGTFDQAVAARLQEIAEHLALAHSLHLAAPNQASVRSSTAAVADRLARAATQVNCSMSFAPQPHLAETRVVGPEEPRLSADAPWSSISWERLGVPGLDEDLPPAKPRTQEVAKPEGTTLRMKHSMADAVNKE